MQLGETSSFEEAQLRERIKQDTNFDKFSIEIEKTLHLLSDAMDSGQADKDNAAKETIDGQNGAIQAILPVVDQVLNFNRSIQVKGDESLQIVLKSDSPAGDFLVGKLRMQFIILIGLGLVRAVAPKKA